MSSKYRLANRKTHCRSKGVALEISARSGKTSRSVAWNGVRADVSLAAETECLKGADLAKLASLLSIGDVVFIRVTFLPFRKVASTTQCWSNHVGIVIDVAGPEPIIGESTFPFSKSTTLSRFVARSEKKRTEVRRLNVHLTLDKKAAISLAARKRMGIFYDTGFNINSQKQFCSRYVHEVIADATGVEVGKREMLSTFLTRNPKTDLAFWRIWYFGNIPWQRETVTPASLLQSPALHRVFNGCIGNDSRNLKKNSRLGLRGTDQQEVAK